MKKWILYLLGFAALAAAMISCGGSDDDFVETDIYGKWQLVTQDGKDMTAQGEYWKYHSDGTGYTWVEADDEYEEDALPFTWTFSDNQLRQNHIMTGGGSVPKGPYTITDLSSSRMTYKDEWTSRTFRKVN